MLFQLAVYIPCQSIYIPSETGLIGKYSVEPAEMLSCLSYHYAHIHHSKQSSNAYDIPLPSTEEDIAKHHCQKHKHRVNAYLNLRKLHSRNRTYCHGKTFTWHRHRTATHLQGYTYAENGASCHLRNNLYRQCRRHEPFRKQHVEIDERSENKANKQLEQLHSLKPPPQHTYLPHYKHAIHYIRELPYRQFRHAKPSLTSRLKHIR